MDKFSKEKRSDIMSRVRGENTKPEELVRKYLFSKGFRYRKNDKRYPGKPDIVLPKYNAMVFVNGCFWHQHEGCKDFVWPKNNAEFWKEKLTRNAARDKIVEEELRLLGWNVLIIWECELKKEKRQSTLEATSRYLDRIL